MKHFPVLKDEVINALNIKSDGIYVDLTLGRAGHSSEILKRLDKGKLIAFDLDIDAINESHIILDKISKNYILIHDNFRNIKSNLEKLNIYKVDGILMDLGVSSPQLDDPTRGFSFNSDARLDMRMNKEQALSAYEVVNNYSLKDLCRILRDYGEEDNAYNIVKNIIKYRENKPIESTKELVNIIEEVSFKKRHLHPATLTFQALRIEVNKELDNLSIALNDSISLLNKKSRLVVITFHSLEDRIVKNTFKGLTTIEGNRNDDYTLPKEKKLEYKLINKKPILPSKEELEINTRSHSAKLRIIEKL